jgi:tRNA1Val (adenine37-N6)-methyltransferase
MLNSKQIVPIELPGFPFLVFQTKSGQTVTEDTPFLLDTVLKMYENKPLNVLELGSGTGILSIMMKLHRPGWTITGIEIQPHLVELSIGNASNCSTNVQFLEGDLRNIADYLPLNEFDLIVANPPYFKKGDFRLSQDNEKAISRHEILCTMDDFLTAVSKMLKPGGKAFLLYPLSRVAELKEKIKNIDLQDIAEFSLSTMSNNKDRTIIVELVYADH